MIMGAGLARGIKYTVISSNDILNCMSELFQKSYIVSTQPHFDGYTVQAAVIYPWIV